MFEFVLVAGSHESRRGLKHFKAYAIQTLTSGRRLSREPARIETLPCGPSSTSMKVAGSHESRRGLKLSGSGRCCSTQQVAGSHESRRGLKRRWRCGCPRTGSRRRLSREPARIETTTAVPILRMRRVAGSHESRRGLKQVTRVGCGLARYVAGSHESRRGLKP